MPRSTREWETPRVHEHWVDDPYIQRYRINLFERVHQRFRWWELEEMDSRRGTARRYMRPAMIKFLMNEIHVKNNYKGRYNQRVDLSQSRPNAL